MLPFRVLLVAYLCLPAFAATPSWIAVNKAGDGFVLSDSGKLFVPWGFNYFRDERVRLLEDYWNDEGPEGWAKAERDFRSMKRLGANVIRLHLQFAKFMDAPGKPNQTNLARLKKVIDLAEDLGLYLDITGLGTYRASDVPSWYRDTKEKEHWAAQAQFWEAIAQLCANRPSVFAYNILNEPLTSSSKRKSGEWAHPNLMDGYHYVEYINLDPAGRKAPEIALAWLRQMTQAIRKYDQRHLITVGLIWVENSRPELWSGFPPDQVAREVDFLAVHVYPEKGKINVALDSLRRYRVGKPILIEETFPMKCSPAEYSDFVQASRGIASGWLAHYWSLTPEELVGTTDIVNGLLLDSLRLFQSLNPNH
ncbi:MAG: glycoside hydrolase family 5 protein [Acidobacteriia bacterium]|nr:glycoside hydrolase family 5 protein [Terriglobia bacterium]